MNTQAINTNSKNAKAKENLKKGAALAGAAAIGAGVVVSAEALSSMDEVEVVEPIVPTDNDSTSQTEEENTTETAEAVAQNVAPATDQHEAHTAEPQPQHTEPQPQHTESHEQPTPEQTTETAEVFTGDLPNVDPNLVAQNLTDNVVMVDPEDIDYANLDIAAVGKVETVDGQVFSAAQFTDSQGETLYMVDVDHDGTYEYVTDESGTIVDDVPTTLTVSDTEQILSVNQGDTGYLAQNEHDNTDNDNLTDNAMDDVVALG